jgi:hypothetical protein
MLVLQLQFVLQQLQELQALVVEMAVAIEVQQSFLRFDQQLLAHALQQS